MNELAPEIYEALKADIARNGISVPIEIDENGNILDGHHRYRAWVTAPGANGGLRHRAIGCVI
jgi:hypothetical protein